MKGRKPKPTMLKVLANNPGKRPLNDREPLPGSARSVPAAPDYLSNAARAHWDKCAAQLHPLGLLTRLDEDALGRYCEMFARLIEAQDAIKEHGLLVKAQSGFPVQSPYLSIANRCMDALNKLAAEFGMTPSSRSRVMAPDGNQGKRGGMEF